MSSLQITVSPGPRTNAHGRSVQLDGAEPVVSYVQVLEDLRGEDAWYAAGTYREGHRCNEDWQGASAVTGDLDYLDAQGKHVAPSADARAALDLALADAPGCIAYHTPRGARVDAVLEHPVADCTTWQRAADGLLALLAAWLRRHRLDADKAAGLPGYSIDIAARKPAQFMFGPRSRVDGVERDGTVRVLRPAPYAVEDLLAAAPVPAEPAKANPVRPSQALAHFEKARAAFDSDHPLTATKRGSPCPVSGCAGEDSFKGDASKATCFHSSHPDKCGTRGQGCTVFDSLDVEAFNAGRTPREHLIAEGYYCPAPVREEPPPPGDDRQDPAQTDFAPHRPHLTPLADAVGPALELFTRRYTGEEQPLPLPWPSVSRTLGGGLWPGAHVITGTTASGKTALALQAALCALRAGRPTLYVGLELDVAQIIARLASLELGETFDARVAAHWSDIYLGRVDPTVVAPALERLRSLPLVIEEAPPGGWSARSLRHRVDGLLLAHPDHAGRAPLVVLDFLQLVGPTVPGGRHEELRERIGAAAYAGREVARRSGAVVLMLSSISRAGALELGKHASSATLGTGDPTELVGLGKESGDIEFSADSVMCLAREPRSPGMYESLVWLALAKIRAGVPAWSLLRFNGSWLTEVPQTAQQQHVAERRTAKDAAKAERDQAAVDAAALEVLGALEAGPLSTRGLRSQITRSNGSIDQALHLLTAEGFIERGSPGPGGHSRWALCPGVSHCAPDRAPGTGWKVRGGWCAPPYVVGGHHHHPPPPPPADPTSDAARNPGHTPSPASSTTQVLL